jgi:hypothetical protein
MKRIIIIDTYPSGLRESEILSECIDSLKPLGYDIMITSHYPINMDISSKVNYVVFDKENTFLPPERTPFFWYKSEQFDVHIFNAGHTLPICRNMRNGLHLAQCLKYDEFIFTESDVIYSVDDLKKLDGLINEMSSSSKKMLFFRPELYRDCNNSYVYETLIFGGNINFFLTAFNPPMDISDWDRLNMGYTLELSFYEQFSKYEDEFMLVHDHSSNIFTTSKVNLSRYGLFNCAVLFSEKYPNQPALFLMNSLVEKTTKYVEIFIDDQLINTIRLDKSCYWLDTYTFNDSKISLYVYDNEDKKYLFMNKEFVLSNDNKENFKQKGIIKFK